MTVFHSLCFYLQYYYDSDEVQQCLSDPNLVINADHLEMVLNDCSDIPYEKLVASPKVREAVGPHLVKRMFEYPHVSTIKSVFEIWQPPVDHFTGIASMLADKLKAGGNTEKIAELMKLLP